MRYPVASSSSLRMFRIIVKHFQLRKNMIINRENSYSIHFIWWEFARKSQDEGEYRVIQAQRISLLESYHNDRWYLLEHVKQLRLAEHPLHLHWCPDWKWTRFILQSLLLTLYLSNMRLTKSTLKCLLETIESSLCLYFRNGLWYRHSIKTISQFRIGVIMR